MAAAAASALMRFAFSSASVMAAIASKDIDTPPTKKTDHKNILRHNSFAFNIIAKKFPYFK